MLLGLLFLLVPAWAAKALIPPNSVLQQANNGELEAQQIEEAKAEHAALLADAIDFAEGRCAPGASGEQGCFQYLPSTWRAYSMDVVGKVLPQTPANERMVTEGKIRKWKDEGMTDRGVFLTWNQGSATGWGPGSTDCYKGVNKWGVPYNSCDYAARGLQYLAEHGQ